MGRRGLRGAKHVAPQEASEIGDAADASEPHISERVAELQAKLSEIGGASTLSSFDESNNATIDLSTAHPSSLPQLLTGQPTLLSNLFRDEVSLHGARRGADRLAAKHTELAAVRGIDAVALALGLVSYAKDADTFSGPILTRQLRMRRRHNDVELTLTGAFTANPALISLLEAEFGVHVDPIELAARAYENGVFSPNAVIEFLRLKLQGVPGVTATSRLLISTFTSVGDRLAALVEPTPTRVLAALEGEADAVNALHKNQGELTLSSADDRSPAADTFVLDADTEQEDVLARVQAGHTIAVHVLPGTGGTQTIINAIGALVHQGKRVLVVSGRRSTLDAIRHRFAAVGLAGLGVLGSNARADFIRSISRNEATVPPDVADIDDALVRLRTLLRNYSAALVRTRPGAEASVLDAVRVLTALAAYPAAPRTTARLSPESIAALANGRQHAAELLVEAANLGEFETGPDDSPWYGVSFASIEAAQAARDLAARLARHDVPALLEQAYNTIGQTRLHPFQSLIELSSQLRLLDGVRSSLDVFSPTVFERPLGELIRATGTRAESDGQSFAVRQRLRKLAKDFVRPGAHIDLHEQLQKAQTLRAQWKSAAEEGSLPSVPAGIDPLIESAQTVANNLAQLQTALGSKTELASLSLPDLLAYLRRLGDDSPIFDNLVERAQVRGELSKLGLDALLADLSRRHVPAQRVRDELEYCWWQSVLESALTEDRALLGANTEVLTRLERDFRLVDEAHGNASGKVLAAQLARQWQIAIVDFPEEAAALKQALLDPHSTATQLSAAAPTLVRQLAPVWAASPYTIGDVPQAISFDTVILADAASLSILEAIPALQRAEHVVAFGDPVTQAPTPFTVDAPFSSEYVEEDGARLESRFDTSVYNALADVIPELQLTRSYRAGGEDLAALINDAFYGGRIQSLPWAGSYLGRGSLAVEFVDGGVGTPNPVSGTVEAPEAEVERVLALVRDHARTRPEDSLMIIAGNEKTAERTRHEVTKTVTRDASLAEFVRRRGPEPFTVLTLEQAAAETRDRVIFSLGYGITRHGRVLSDLGELSLPGGERLLAIATTRARRAITLVSSIRPASYEDERFAHGAASLMRILADVGVSREQPMLDELADPLGGVLAQKLRARGIDVTMNYRGQLPMVARYGEQAAVIDLTPEETDESLRERLRYRPNAVRQLGWNYIRVHAFDVYRDSDAVVQRIGETLGAPPPIADTDLDATVPLPPMRPGAQ